MTATQPADLPPERECAWCEFPESVVGPLRAVPLYGETHALCAHCCRRYLGTADPTSTRAEGASSNHEVRPVDSAGSAGVAGPAPQSHRQAHSPHSEAV